MNLPSDVKLPELKLHLEFKDPSNPFKNSVETSRYFSDVNHYTIIVDEEFIKKYTECKNSTFTIHYKDSKSPRIWISTDISTLLGPFFVEYYVQVGDGKNISVPTFSNMIKFTDNLIPDPPNTYTDFFERFDFINQFWTNSCYLNLQPWYYGKSRSDFGPTFESINDTDENLNFDVNDTLRISDRPSNGNRYESSIPINFAKITVDPYESLNFKKLKDYLNINDNDFIKYGFLVNIDSNNFIHMRYYINDIFVFHLKSKQTHLPLNTSNLFSLGFDYIDKSYTTIKDFKLYCHIDNDEITKNYIKDGAVGTNRFKSSIKVIEDPSLKSKEEVEDEINKQLALNPYIDLNELQIFAKINDNNLYPVTFAIQDGKVHIKYTDFIARKQLYLGSKRQFIHHQYIL